MKAIRNYIIASAVLVSSGAFAAGPPVGYVFTPSTPIRANEMNANFQELADRIAAVQGGTSNSVKLKIFNTSNAVTGLYTRKAMIEACTAVDSASTFCSSERIRNAIKTVGVEFASSFSGGWVDAVDYASCYGYTSNNSAAGGAIISASGNLQLVPEGYGGTPTVGCSSTLNIVCCK